MVNNLLKYSDFHVSVINICGSCADDLAIRSWKEYTIFMTFLSGLSFDVLIVLE